MYTFLFNIVFVGTYPMQWTFSKVFNIYKKGDRLDTGNYRGIRILVALAKLYDLVLSRRFNLWYVLKYEQAVAQKRRGCEEQIQTIRLLIDIACKSKCTLYIAFIDYPKAYDKVNRWTLFRHLDLNGCGTVFLQALATSMKNVSGTIGSESFSASTRVHQGASTSYTLFTFFIEFTLLMQLLPWAWWLAWQSSHSLTNECYCNPYHFQEANAQTVEITEKSADEIGMVIHLTKSRFMCMKSTDNEDFILGNANICYTDSYTYLGTPISCRCVSEQVQQHLNAKSGHLLKFTSFLAKKQWCPVQCKEICVEQCTLKCNLLQLWDMAHKRP